jgi:hypothetical protein
MWQSWMDNLDTLSTLCTQDTERRSKNTIKHRQIKRWKTRTPPKLGVNPGAREGKAYFFCII